MRALLITALLAAATFNFHSTAQAECVPTKSVPAATADYNAELAASDVSLKQSYAAALSAYNNALAGATKNYYRELDIARDIFAQKINAISAKRFEPEWRQQVEAITAEFNQSEAVAASNYNLATQNAKAIYTSNVIRAQTSYSSEVQTAATRYNQAVCAQP